MSLLLIYGAAIAAVIFDNSWTFIDKEMSRLGWGVQQGQGYILEKYGKKSRQVLSDAQLLEFLEYLKEQPKFKVGQTAIFRGTKVIIERLINQFTDIHIAPRLVVPTHDGSWL